MLEIYSSRSPIEDEAFTQRLKNIYKKFKITGKGHKLPQLHKYLTERYLEYQQVSPNRKDCSRKVTEEG